MQIILACHTILVESLSHVWPATRLEDEFHLRIALANPSIGFDSIGDGLRLLFFVNSIHAIISRIRIALEDKLHLGIALEDKLHLRIAFANPAVGFFDKNIRDGLRCNGCIVESIHLAMFLSTG